MNEIANNFILTGDTFMSVLYVRQPGCIYSACGPFTKRQRKKPKN